MGSLMRTRIKICGVTRHEDAQQAAYLGADAIGLVFYPHSPRLVTVEQACAIVRDLPPFVSRVALFVDAAPEEIHYVLERVPIDYLQFHGKEPPQFCAQFKQPFLKVLRMRSGLDVIDYAADYSEAAALLLDTFQDGVPGGTGQTFDWTDVPGTLQKPLLLAGGLTAANVADAIRTVRPYAVDVSGGVEASPGIKDAGKMAAFIQAVRSVD